ncbi:hypothetical protein HO173_005930 [Letharia columbiana]|uniref:SprT-like domain-containing protein n=1 Tax=Letharia columbiana TaxID=112416 RepID=A0A8H6FVW7_9LECA|nr:uncharacterized protein HO173_005930 [Letharia columbiana]KAF6235735.1 hypothetical protein HO173_005930 [Letharia columbiana]
MARVSTGIEADVLNYLTMSRAVLDTAARYLNDSARQRLREQTKEPVSWDIGAQYDHPHGDLNDYQEFRTVARAQLTKAQATQLLVDFLTPLEHLHTAQKKALNRLDAAARHPKWDPSLVIKALADLDIAFFDGRLKGNVIVMWATEREILERVCDGQNPEKGFTGLCQPLQPDENEGEQRCKVWLNSDKIFNAPDPRLQMWETMFHELVHAYALVSSDRDGFIDYHAYNDPYHDDQFGIPFEHGRPPVDVSHADACQTCGKRPHHLFNLLSKAVDARRRGIWHGRARGNVERAGQRSALGLSPGGRITAISANLIALGEATPGSCDRD